MATYLQKLPGPALKSVLKKCFEVAGLVSFDADEVLLVADEIPFPGNKRLSLPDPIIQRLMGSLSGLTEGSHVGMTLNKLDYSPESGPMLVQADCATYHNF